MRDEDTIWQYLALIDFVQMEARSSQICSDCHWYLFGSVLHGECSPIDIDLLAVVGSVRDGVELRAAMSEWLRANPIHLVIMTEAELRETNFIKVVRARRLVTLRTTSRGGLVH